MDTDTAIRRASHSVGKQATAGAISYMLGGLCLSLNIVYSRY